MRNTAKAIIVRDGQVLLLRRRDPDGDRYVLPGGRQEPGETLLDALQRECREEIGTPVLVGELRYVADSFHHPHRPGVPPAEAHTVMFFFLCDVPADYHPTSGTGPDRDQVDVVWVPLVELQTIRLFPPVLTERLLADDFPSGPVYLGAIT